MPDPPARAVEGGRVKTAVTYTTLATAVSFIIGFARAPILARLLSSSDYGLFGLSASVVAGLSVFTYLGLSQSLIVRKFDDGESARPLIDSCWTGDLVRRILLSAALMAISYPVAQYFGEPRLAPLLMASALTPAIQGFQNIGLVLLRKSVSYRNIAMFRVISELLATLISIGIALVTRDVWALVLGQVAAQLLCVPLSYLLHPYRPRFHFDRSLMKDSFSFGRQFYFVGLFDFAMTQFDNFVVGKMLGVAILGAYVVAYRLATLPLTIVHSSIGEVMFPAISRAKGEGQGKAARLAARGIVLTFTILALSILPMRLAAGEIIRFVYGSRWDAAIPLLEALAVLAICRGWTRSVTPLLFGIGRPDLEVRTRILETGLFMPLTIWAVGKYGAAGAAMAGAFSYSITFAVRSVLAVRLVDDEAHDVRNALLTMVSLSVVSYLATLAIPNTYLKVLAFTAIFVLGVLWRYGHYFPELTSRFSRKATLRMKG